MYVRCFTCFWCSQLIKLFIIYSLSPPTPQSMESGQTGLTDLVPPLAIMECARGTDRVRDRIVGERTVKVSRRLRYHATRGPVEVHMYVVCVRQLFLLSAISTHKHTCVYRV